MKEKLRFNRFTPNLLKNITLMVSFPFALSGNALQVIMWVLSELRLIDLTRNCSTASYHSIKKDILPFLKKHAGVLLGGIAKLPDSLFKTCIKIMTRNSNLFMNFERYPTGESIITHSNSNINKTNI